MTTIKAISAAMKLIDVKKENLRKAFEDLQTHSSSLSSFNITWSDLDSYFNSLQSSLQHQFKLLQTLESQPPSSSAITTKNSTPTVLVRARPELKSLCEKMDGLGLRQYIINRPKEKMKVRAELVDAFRSSPDAAAMILNAMEGFSSIDDPDLRRACVVLLEEFVGLKMEVKREVRERAMKLAVEWKGKIASGNTNGDNNNNTFEIMGFMLLVAAYGLVYGFNMDELVDCAFIIAKNRIATQLCRMLNFGDKISDLIQKLCSAGKQILAIKFIFEFEMTDKFPPVPLLRAYAKESKDIVHNILKSGNKRSLEVKEATSKELKDLRSVIKCIEDYKLESEYPKNILLRRIEKLEKEKKSDGKRTAAAPAFISQQQANTQKESGIKRSRTTAAAVPATIPASTVTSITFPSSDKAILTIPTSGAVTIPKSNATNLTIPKSEAPNLTILKNDAANLTISKTKSDVANLTIPKSVYTSASIPLYPEPIQMTGFLPDHHAPYSSSPAGPYGMSSSNSAVVPYTAPSDGLYEFPTAPKSVSSSSAIPLYPQPPLQMTSLLPNHHAPFLSSPAGSYGMSSSNPAVAPGSNPAVAPYTAPSEGQYELYTVPNSVSSSSTIPLYSPPPIQMTGLLPNHSAPYQSSQAGPYGTAGANPAVVPYTASSEGLYESSEAPISFSGSVPTTGSNLYPSGSHVPSGYFDGQYAYGGYGLPPQYHPTYYPQ